jgi:ABC-type branched-subunit amino acid transport system ATPase component
MPSTDMRIETENLGKRFGGVVALEDVTLEFPSGSVTAIIGPNGAGKTTLFNVIAGFLRPDSGSVYLIEEGEQLKDTPVDSRNDIVGLPPYDIARKGLGVLFQDIRVFKALSALENIAVGFKRQSGENPVRCLFQPAKVRREESEIMERARYYLDYVGLSEKAHLWTAQLSYGQQKLVAIARLLAGDAKVLLLDEPTSGVHPDMIDRLLDLVQRLADEERRAVVMIEHNLNVVRRVGDWVYLLAGGRVEVFGEPREVLRDSTLQEVFPTL